MELFLEILGYGFIFVVVGLMFFVFTKILSTALHAMSNNDD